MPVRGSVSSDTRGDSVTGMPRPITELTHEQRQLLARAVRLAERSREVSRRMEQEMWDAAIAARKAGVPDDLIAAETGLSRATMNRRYGPRRELGV